MSQLQMETGEETQEAAPTDAAASPPDAETSEQPDASSAQEGEDRSVPLKALQEERQARQQAQQQVHQLSQQFQQFQNAAAERERAIQEQLMRLQNPGEDPNAPLRRPFEEGAQTDEDRQRADRAFDAVDQVVQARIKEALEQVDQTVSTRVNETVDGRFSALNETLTAGNTINQLVQQGRLSQENAKALNQRVEQKIQQDPRWTNHRSLVVKEQLADMYANGEIQMPAQQPQPSFPGGPGSPRRPAGGSDDKQHRTEELEGLRSKFRSLQSKELDELDKLVPKSQGQKQPFIDRESGQQVMLDSDLVSAAYEHRR